MSGHNVGELRPSQLLFTNGVGAVVDLPEISAMVLGIDDWPVESGRKLTEPRLLTALQDKLGNQVAELRAPPETPEGFGPLDDAGRIGVPVAPFPTWLRCPKCRLLAPLGSGLFTLKPEPFRPDRVRYTHDCDGGKGRVVAIAARFLLACRRGHHDDFPWAEFVHRGKPCPGKRWELELRELGMGAEAAKVEVRCRTCDSARRMSEAFGTAAEDNLPACRGYHPHLGSVEGACDEPARTILLGASNSWFPITLSVVAIPTEQDALAQLVADAWSDLQEVDSEATLKFALPRLPELAPLRGHPLGSIWAAIEARRSGDTGDEGPLDLRIAEWEVLADPSGVPPTEDFRTRVVPVPREHADLIAEVVLCERLREVVALTGFTRVESPDDLDVAGDSTPTAPISRAAPTWVPCVEVRGEGVFIRFDEERVAAWERVYRKSPSATRLLEGHRLWRARRNLDPAEGFPGWRYLLLHTFSHALLRELALECGYSASSIRERIYATRPDGEGPDMAGVLLYTAAPDSEGTLGGLVALGEPQRLGRLLDQALDHALLCSSDPLCSEHDPREDRSAHLAACHACQFAAETSCERGNRYLDRAVLGPTFAVQGLGFFRGPA